MFASRNARLGRSGPTPSPDFEKWLAINAEFARVWPNITAKREPPPDAKEWESVPGKYEKYFSPKPGDSYSGTGAEAGAADVASPFADELQDP